MVHFCGRDLLLVEIELMGHVSKRQPDICLQASMHQPSLLFVLTAQVSREQRKVDGRNKVDGKAREGIGSVTGRRNALPPHENFKRVRSLTQANAHTLAPPSVSCSCSLVPSCGPSCPCCWILERRATRRARVYSAADCTTCDPSSCVSDCTPVPKVAALSSPAATPLVGLEPSGADVFFAHCDPDKVCVFWEPLAAADAVSSSSSPIFLKSGWLKSVEVVTTRGASVRDDNAAPASLSSSAVPPEGALAGACDGAIFCEARWRVSMACTKNLHISACVPAHIKK